MLTLLFLFQISTAGSSVAHASLGDDSSTVENDRARVHGVRRSTSHSKYNVHEIKSSGITLKEYESESGKIFAVTWTGGGQPDLKPLFSSYFDDFSEANKSSSKSKVRGARSHSEVTGSKIVVNRFGHMGNIHGKAYVKSLIPEGVSIDEIR